MSTSLLDLTWDRWMARRRPSSVHIDLLFACDLDCSHCYLSVRQAKGLSTQRYLDLLDELAETGVLHVLFSGGEIFLRKDALTILRHARKRRFVVKLITHAGRISEEIADALAEMGIAEVAVSLYSMKAEDHDAITRKPGSLERTLRGIQRLRERDLNVQIKLSVMPENRLSWPTVIPWAEAMGCELQLSDSIHAKDDDDLSHVEKMNVSYPEKVAVARVNLGKLFEEQGRKVWATGSGEDLDEAPCTAGQTTCYIHPSGKVYPCAIFYWPVGDITKQSFQEIWDDSPRLKQLRTITKRSFYECQDCAFLEDCSHCLAKQLQERGDMLARSELVCHSTHAVFQAASELGVYDGEVPAPPRPTAPAHQPRPPCASDTAVVGGGGNGCSSCAPGTSAGPVADFASQAVPDLKAWASGQA